MCSLKFHSFLCTELGTWFITRNDDLLRRTVRTSAKMGNSINVLGYPIKASRAQRSLTLEVVIHSPLYTHNAGK